MRREDRRHAQAYQERSFDSHFESGMIFFRPFDCRRLREKRSYWREQGKSSGLTPDEASFRAFKEFADEYYQENHTRPDDAINDFETFAYALEYAAPSFDRDGKYKERRTFLSTRWSAYLDKYNEKRGVEEKTFEEVLRYKFPREEIDAAWGDLLRGDIPDEAIRIWQAAGGFPGQIAHSIVSIAQVSVREFVFWMVVFREHRLMTEHQFGAQHRYESKYLSSKPSDGLDERTLKIVARLNRE